MSYVFRVFILTLVFSSPIFSQTELQCERTCVVKNVVYEGATLGVYLKPNCGDNGAYISEIVPNSTADKSLLKPNDLLLYFNDVEIKYPKHFSRIISKLKPFQEVTIVFERKSKVYTIQVVLGAKNTKIVEEEICCDTFNFEESISVYPNPSSKNLHVSFKSLPKGKYAFEIFNLNGVRFYSSEKETLNNSLTKTISVDDLEEGVYVLKIHQEANTFSSLFAVKKQ